MNINMYRGILAMMEMYSTKECIVSMLLSETSSCIDAEARF